MFYKPFCGYCMLIDVYTSPVAWTIKLIDLIYLFMMIFCLNMILYELDQKCLRCMQNVKRYVTGAVGICYLRLLKY